jgi:hypothetical protein
MADAPATSTDPIILTDAVTADAPVADMVPGEVVPDENPLDEFHEKMNAFKALRDSDQQAADQLLAALGGHGKVEEEMILQLSAWKPLYRADQFEGAHQNAMRALEVLYRNGHRNAKVPNLGPLTWFAKYFVKVFTQLIVRDHVQSVVGSITNLYLRRWTSAPKETPDATMLRRAAMQVERVTPGYKGRSLALPTFLLGGAFLSSISSLLGNLVDSGKENTTVLIVLLVALYALLFALGWCLLRGAAVARTRIKLALDEPLRILWSTVGAAGSPPKDGAMDYALYAFIILGLSAIVVPLIVTVLVLQ